MSKRIDENVKAKLERLPKEPGVYLMHDAGGKVIYVGKSVNLRARVHSYFHASTQHDAKTRQLVSKIADIDWIIVSNEVEALILENSLIKRYQPHYNIQLKDDKQYPYIKVHWQMPFPKVTMTRYVISDGARYYGPYTSAWSVRQTLEGLRRVFPYLSCDRKITGQDSRACLYYDIKQCAGPCIGAIDQAAYREMIDQLCHFLEGDSESVLEQLRQKMQTAADRLQFELAATYRDRLAAAERIAQQQQVVAQKGTDMDVIGLANDDGDSCLQIFFVRHGKLLGRDSFTLTNTSGEIESNIVSSFLTQFYDQAAHIPPQILLPVLPGDAAVIEKWLYQQRQAKVQLRAPHHGPKRDLLELAQRNAAETLARLQEQWQREAHRQTEAVAALQEVLGMAVPPNRIEGYDISTLQGSNSVGSMVVFQRGVPEKSHYRRFHIQSVQTTGRPDDYASMAEMLSRRFRRAVASQQDQPGQESNVREKMWRLLPDLVLIDGGKGQLGVAVKVLRQFGLEDQVTVLGLAKQREEIFLPGRAIPLRLSLDSPALRLLQRVRDEAHRFAITFQRQTRRKRGLASSLDAIPGIGPRRRQALLRRFGSVAAIREAPLDALSAVPGMNRAVAQRLKEELL